MTQGDHLLFPAPSALPWISVTSLATTALEQPRIPQDYAWLLLPLTVGVVVEAGNGSSSEDPP